MGLRWPWGPVMDDNEDEAGTPRGRGSGALDELLLVPAAILGGLPDAVVATARDGRIVFVNTLAEELFGYPRDELVGAPVQTLWPEDVRDRYTRNMELYFATEHPLRFSHEAWGLRKDGTRFVGEMSWGIVETNAGPLLLAIGRDISARRAAEARLRAVAAIGERALAGADPVDLATEAVELLRDTLPVAHAEVRLSGGRALAVSGTASESDVIRLPVGAGDELIVTPTRVLADDEVSVLRALATTLASGLARLRGEERMRYEAVHDPLTGLANRTLLRDRLEHAVARADREGGATGILFVDLDGFKEVNDAHGHAAGDDVLVELASRLRRTVRPADTVARLGGDEFVVVCEDVDEASALALGERLLESIESPLAIRDVKHHLSASIGVALGPCDPDTLLAHADTAVYRAKAAGRGRVELFHPTTA